MKQTPLISRARQFLGATEGVSAVEFALILPVLVILFLGAIETTLFVQADRRVSWAASTMADLTSRVKEVNFCGAEDVFAASSRIIRPDSTKGVSMRISAISKDKKGKTEVTWSQGRNQKSRKKKDVADIDPALIPSEGEVIVAEVTYDYKSTFSFFLPVSKELSDRFVMRPRDDDSVAWDGPRMSTTGCEHMNAVAWEKVVGS